MNLERLWGDGKIEGWKWFKYTVLTYEFLKKATITMSVLEALHAYLSTP